MRPQVAVILAWFASQLLHAAQSNPPSFDKTVQPLLRQSCTMCHNEKLASGGLNISPFLYPASVNTNREGWERIVAKLHTGEMPPKGMPRPPAEKLDALMKYVQD